MKKKDVFLIIITALLTQNCKEQKRLNKQESQSVLESSVKNDSLGFSEFLKSIEYNKYTVVNIVSGKFNLCTDSLSVKNINEVSSDFYSNLPKSYTIANGLVIKSARLLCTENWKILEIRFGNKSSDYISSFIGCFIEDKVFILKNSFDDVCSEKNIKIVNESANILKITLCEHYSCDGEDQSFYDISFEVNNDKLKKVRTLRNQPCNH